MRKKILHPTTLFCIGLLLGIVSRLLDIYTQNLGNLFSQMAIWILFGVLISIYSSSQKQAMLNIAPFCLGMLLTYYCVVFLKKGVYSTVFIIGWTVFAVFSPVLAYFTWLTKEKGVFPKLIGVGILLVSVLSSIILLDQLRVYDIVIDGFLIYFLFFKRIDRTG